MFAVIASLSWLQKVVGSSAAVSARSEDEPTLRAQLRDPEFDDSRFEH
jgi:hypothetical protein